MVSSAYHALNQSRILSPPCFYILYSDRAEKFDSRYKNDEKQVFKTKFSSNYFKLPTERIFESPTVKKIATRPRGSRSMSRNDGKKHAFSENVCLVFNTEHSICKTPPPKFSTELQSLIQCSEILKDKLSKLYIFPKCSSGPSE